MIWDWSVKGTDVAIIVATVLGPILAVQAQKWLERGRAIQDRREGIFRVLMATRAAMLSQTHVEALNAIPVEFYGTKGKLKEINDAWKLYLDHHTQEGNFSDAWMHKRLDLFNDLMHRISEYLGYGFSRAQLARDIYSPKAHGDLETDQIIIRQGLAKLLSGESVLPMAVKELPDTLDEATLENQAKIQALLLEWLSGNRSVNVVNESKLDQKAAE